MDISDPIEREFAALCQEFGIVVQRPEQRGGRLDFFLPEFGLYVEVKAYSSERLHSQLESVNAGAVPVMVLIGLSSIVALRLIFASLYGSRH